MTNRSDVATADVVPRVAFQSLAILNQLIIEAGQCDTHQELAFHILNKTVTYTHYDRAYLFAARGDAWKFLGASGTSMPDRQSAPVADRLHILSGLRAADQPQHLQADSVLESSRESLTRLQQEAGGSDFVVVPIVVRETTVALLWLERWEDRPWQEGELKRLLPLTSGYGGAWRAFASGLTAAWAKHSRKLLGIVALLLLGLLPALLFIQLPLRIVAPCEVVPNQPVAITAPIQGVIQAIRVEPGDSVAAGQLLFVYEKQIFMDELQAAHQRVSAMLAQLEQAQAEALNDPARRSDVRTLQSRLAEEEARLAIAEYRAERLDVTAPSAGVALFNDSNEWRGRPVAVGERVMVLVEPGRSKVRIWLPQDDKIMIDPSRPVHVLLNTATSDSAQAELAYVSEYAEMIPAGGVGFAAEAVWSSDPQPHWMGLNGSAVLYGPRVPLYLWLFRRPFNSVRRYLGW